APLSHRGGKDKARHLAGFVLGAPGRPLVPTWPSVSALCAVRVSDRVALLPAGKGWGEGRVLHLPPPAEPQHWPLSTGRSEEEKARRLAGLSVLPQWNSVLATRGVGLVLFGRLPGRGRLAGFTGVGGFSRLGLGLFHGFGSFRRGRLRPNLRQLVEQAGGGEGARVGRGRGLGRLVGGRSFGFRGRFARRGGRGFDVGSLGLDHRLAGGRGGNRGGIGRSGFERCSLGFRSSGLGRSLGRGRRSGSDFLDHRRDRGHRRGGRGRTPGRGGASGLDAGRRTLGRRRGRFGSFPDRGFSRSGSLDRGGGFGPFGVRVAVLDHIRLDRGGRLGGGRGLGNRGWRHRRRQVVEVELRLVGARRGAGCLGAGFVAGLVVVIALGVLARVLGALGVAAFGRSTTTTATAATTATATAAAALRVRGFLGARGGIGHGGRLAGVTGLGLRLHGRTVERGDRSRHGRGGGRGQRGLGIGRGGGTCDRLGRLLLAALALRLLRRTGARLGAALGGLLLRRTRSLVLFLRLLLVAGRLLLRIAPLLVLLFLTLLLRTLRLLLATLGVAAPGLLATLLATALALLAVAALLATLTARTLAAVAAAFALRGGLGAFRTRRRRGRIGCAERALEEADHAAAGGRGGGGDRRGRRLHRGLLALLADRGRARRGHAGDRRRRRDVELGLGQGVHRQLARGAALVARLVALLAQL